MTATAERRTHQRGAAVEERILDVTLQLLTEQGYLFTVDDVARRAGVHKTTVYRRWDTKPQLVAAAIDRLAANTIEIRTTGDAAADLRSLAVQVARALRSTAGRNALRATFAAAASDDALTTVVRDFFARRYAEAIPLIRSGVRAGTIRGDVDPVLLWQAMVNPMHLNAICGVDTDDDSARALVDLVLAGARPR
jgi:AcrR family transcriptional regulator